MVIIQDDLFQATASATVCPITSDPTDAPIMRVPLEPSEENGLRAPSRAMVDKVTTVPRERLGRRVGQVSGEDLTRIDRALLVFLGLVG